MYKLSVGGVIRLSDGAFVPSDITNVDYRKYLDWIAKGGKALPDDVAPALEAFKEQVADEDWRTAELLAVADQLLRIEDDDPTALPGTSAQWRAYRVALRAFVAGTDERPTRP